MCVDRRNGVHIERQTPANLGALWVHTRKVNCRCPFPAAAVCSNNNSTNHDLHHGVCICVDLSAEDSSEYSGILFSTTHETLFPVVLGSRLLFADHPRHRRSKPVYRLQRRRLCSAPRSATLLIVFILGLDKTRTFDLVVCLPSFLHRFLRPSPSHGLPFV